MFKTFLSKSTMDILENNKGSEWKCEIPNENVFYSTPPFNLPKKVKCVKKILFGT